MRVRYGKPIKVKSLLGNQTNFSFASGNNGDQFCFGNNTYAWSRDNIDSSNYFQNASLIQNHKYYIYFDSYSDRTFTYIYNNGIIYLDENWGITTISGTTTSHGIIQVNNRSIESLSKFYVGKSIGSTWPAPTMLIIIDLTSIGLDNLTAQEFYNKYNKYFPIIATGEEITIDDKAGQVSYSSSLPSGYQRVEYIAKNNSSYIDTGFKPNQDTRVVAKFYNPENVPSSGYIFYGARSLSSGIYDFGLWQQIRADYRTLLVNLTERPGQIIKIDQNKNKVYINDSLEYTFTYANFTSTSNLGILGGIDANGLNYNAYANTRVYYFRIYDNGNLVHSYIPCYRKSDNAIGMYDIIAGEFKTSANNSVFTKGENINTISCKIAGGSSDIYYGYNQQVDFNLVATGTSNGVTFTNNNDGSFTATGSASAYAYKTFAVTLNVGDKYLLVGGPSNTSSNCGLTVTSPSMYDYGSGVIFTANQSNIHVYMFVQNGYAISGSLTYKPQLINLTEWFGAGKEPSTVQEFKEKFIKEYYGTCITPIKLTRYQIEALPTYGYNQMIPTAQININWTYDNSASSSAKWASHTLNGTGWGSYVDHKVLFYFNGVNNNSDNSQIGVYIVNANNQMRYLNAFDTGVIIPITQQTGSSGLQYGTYIGAGEKLNVQGSVVSVDLTEWYGAGNEPATVEEFKQTFPNKYYSYSKKRLLNKYMINKLID